VTDNVISTKGRNPYAWRGKIPHPAGFGMTPPKFYAAYTHDWYKIPYPFGVAQGSSGEIRNDISHDFTPLACLIGIIYPDLTQGHNREVNILRSIHSHYS